MKRKKAYNLSYFEIIVFMSLLLNQVVFFMSETWPTVKSIVVKILKILAL